MITLNIQKRNNCFIVFFALFCIQSCCAQNKQIKVFFDNKKKITDQACIKELEIDKIKINNENKEVVELMIKSCKDASKVFDNFIDGTTTLLSSLSGKDEDFIIFNWKKYDTYIPAPTVAVLKTDKTNVVEFTYYDEERNTDDITLRKKVYEEKDGKFKNELLYIQGKLTGGKLDDSITQYKNNDYYIIKRVKGKYFFYTLINDELEQNQ